MAGWNYDAGMSNNATMAYEDGEKPISKWTKREILAQIKEQDIDRDTYVKVSKLSLSVLKEICLANNGWHHTSKRFNKTPFYFVRDLSEIEDLDTLIDYHMNKTPEKPVSGIPVIMGFIKWGGSNRHPVPYKYVVPGVLKGNWIHLDNGQKKGINSQNVSYWTMEEAKMYLNDILTARDKAMFFTYTPEMVIEKFDLCYESERENGYWINKIKPFVK